MCGFSYRGAFSEVYRAVEKETHKEYAIKVIKKDALKGKEEALQMEVQVLQKLVALAIECVSDMYMYMYMYSIVLVCTCRLENLIV